MENKDQNTEEIIANTEEIIAQTRKWINEVVIGCNFCPFAARAMTSNGIHYQVENASDPVQCLQAFWQECIRLDANDSIDTTLLIFPSAVAGFNDYLDLVSMAEKGLKKKGYEGVYQVASFHPLYRFSHSKADDPANYTNRSLYPMLHLLREEQITKGLVRYPAPDQIPADNIKFARARGELYMRKLRESCFSV
jgi:hypothetical protein